MAECFCCHKLADPECKLTFEVPGTATATLVFCKKCSKRVGDDIRFLRRIISTGMKGWD